MRERYAALPLDQIEADPLQPRHELESVDDPTMTEARTLQGLAQSIREFGMLQPIRVRRVDDAAGERDVARLDGDRWRGEHRQIVETLGFACGQAESVAALGVRRGRPEQAGTEADRQGQVGGLESERLSGVGRGSVITESHGAVG